METLGYPSEIECPFKELFDKEKWCGWWVEDDNILEFGTDILFLETDLEDHTKSTFYNSKIIESGICEDYGVYTITKDGYTFISHTQSRDRLFDTRLAMYHLKKYIPLVKSSNKII